jgi:U1 small nuclear ribonucleoprotein
MLGSPNDNPNAEGKPSRTVFVGRLDYKTSEDDLRKAMERYGKVEAVKLVKDVKTGKPRGYGFVLFASSKDVTSNVLFCVCAFWGF